MTPQKTFQAALLAGSSALAIGYGAPTMLMIVAAGLPDAARANGCFTATDTFSGSTSQCHWIIGQSGTLTNTGTISGAATGVIVTDTAVGTLINSGSISGSVLGVLLPSGSIAGALMNSGGRISADQSGVLVRGNLGTLTNSGTISAGWNGVIVKNGGSIGTLTNGGGISAGFTGVNVVRGGTIGALTNSGVISAGLTSVNVDGAVGTLTNNGRLSAGSTGVKVYGSIGSLTNSGTISVASKAVIVKPGGSIGTLANGGTISSGSTGVNVSGSIGTLTNSGTISAPGAINIGINGHLGQINNSGLISGNILNLSSNDLTINGGESTFGTLTGCPVSCPGVITNPRSNVVFGSGGILLNDDIIATGITSYSVINSGATLQVNNSRAIVGNYVQNTSATLVIGVGSTSAYGNLVVTGTASMTNGKVVVTAVNGFVFAGGQTFTVVDAGTILSGAYSGVSATTSGAGFTATASELLVGGHDDLVITIVALPTSSEVAITSSGNGSVNNQQPFYTLTDPATQGSTITFAGGTLKIIGTTSTNQAIVIQAAGGKIDSNGATLYLTGAITGSGSLTVSGTTGGEVHANGTVAVPVTVDNTGTLRGTGTISGATTVAGVLSPGNSPGTLTFTAPVTMRSDGTLALDIDGTGTGTGAGNYSRAIVIGGSFTAAGMLAPQLRGITYASTETPGANGYTPTLGQKFAGVVQASGGVTGSFTGLTQPDGLRAGTRFDAVYNPASIDLYVTPSSYGNLPAAGVGQTRNQSSLGSALDAIRPVAGVRASGDTETLFDALAPLDGAALPRALTQVAGEGNANLPLTAVDVGRAFGASVAARLGQTRGGSANLAERASRDLTSLRFGSVGGINRGYGAMTDPEARMAAKQGSGRSAGDATADPAKTLGLWVRGFGQFTDNRGDGDNPGFNRAIAGGLAGADLPALDDVRIGVDVGYARTDLTGRQSSGNATADSYHGGVYAGWTPGPWFATADLGVTWTRFDTTRDLLFGSTGRTAKGKTGALDGGVALEAGRRFDIAGFAVEPSADLRYDLITTNGYTESGADAFNLSVKGDTRHALRAGLGAKASRTFALDNGLKLEPELRARWEHDALDQSYQTSQSINGSAFTVNAAKPGRDAAVLGTGIAAVLDDHLKLYAHYDAELRAHQTDHMITGGVRYSW